MMLMGILKMCCTIHHYFFLQLFAFLHDVLILYSLLLSFKGSFIDDINHTGQVGTQLYMSPEQVMNINK